MTLEEIFAKLPCLGTDRLRIRQMRTTDAPALFAIKSDLEVTKHYGQEPHRSLDQTREWVQKRIADYERREVIFWVLALRDDDTAIGSVCFWNFDPTLSCAEIGYELHPTYWRSGIMSEALSAIITFGFKQLALHRIEANPLAINQASSELLLKLGFKHEGTLRERVFFRGHFIDQLYFGLLEEEWSNTAPGRAIKKAA